MSKKRIAVLCSGGGSNLQSILDAIDAGKIDGEVVLVLANASRAYALERARQAGVEALFVSKKNAGSAKAYNDILLEHIRRAEADMVVLAGYLPLLGEQIIHAYPNRVLNIHPALIPSFCGEGMYGHHVHEAAIAAGVKISGATVHFVDELLDHGGIIMQRSVPVLDSDTADALAARVLTVEHQILPESVALYCAGKLRVDGNRVYVIQ